jgi:hypothetical protein
MSWQKGITAMNDTSGASCHDGATQPDSVVVIVIDNSQELLPLRLLSSLLADEPPEVIFHELPSLFSPALFLERIRPIPIEATPDDKRAVLHLYLDDDCRLEPSLAQPRSSQSPGRSAVKRRRLIQRALRHDPEALQQALLSALAYELIDRLAVVEDNSCRECIQALDECCELIAFMRHQNITRSSFTDEVMNAAWLGHSERFRALRNRQWFNKRKARLQLALRRAAG